MRELKKKTLVSSKGLERKKLKRMDKINMKKNAQYIKEYIKFNISRLNNKIVYNEVNSLDSWVMSDKIVNGSAHELHYYKGKYKVVVIVSPSNSRNLQFKIFKYQGKEKVEKGRIYKYNHIDEEKKHNLLIIEDLMKELVKEVEENQNQKQNAVLADLINKLNVKSEKEKQVEKILKKLSMRELLILEDSIEI